MRIIVILFIFLAGCASLEKRHIFNVDRSDEASRQYLACKEVGASHDPLVVDKYRFYAREESRPDWIGVLFIPMVPNNFEFNFNRLRLIFGSEMPQNPEEWSIKFESDGFVANGKIETSSSKFKLREVVFEFPPREKPERFQLQIPTMDGQVVIKFIETTKWDYTPFWLPLGDSFPHWQTCK